MQKIVVVGGALHEAIRQEIMRRVANNEYKAGETLPSAAALAEEFGVSAITIKRALRDLQSTGILRAVPGLGTFICETRRFVCNTEFGFTSFKDVQRLGLKPRIQLTSVTREAIRHSTFCEFDAPTRTMLCLRRIISVDGIPIIFDTSYLPLSLSDRMVNEFGGKLFCEALHACGARLRETTLLIAAAPVSEEAQQVFGIPNGYAALRRLYELTIMEPSFKIFGMAESPFDRLAFSVDMRCGCSEL
ncbi:GntR family transcriptional regulator [Bradyrhizobium genosp. P]|uniref:GntR family transcriptional regulator n=1 Tax=Bradyrhizobium genosp. P TaxID=83641 RepID=UPI003CE70A32